MSKDNTLLWVAAAVVGGYFLAPKEIKDKITSGSVPNVTSIDLSGITSGLATGVADIGSQLQSALFNLQLEGVKQMFSLQLEGLKNMVDLSTQRTSAIDYVSSIVGSAKDVIKDVMPIAKPESGTPEPGKAEGIGWGEGTANLIRDLAQGFTDFLTGTREAGGLGAVVLGTPAYNALVEHGLLAPFIGSKGVETIDNFISGLTNKIIDGRNDSPEANLVNQLLGGSSVPIETALSGQAKAVKNQTRDLASYLTDFSALIFGQVPVDYGQFNKAELSPVCNNCGGVASESHIDAAPAVNAPVVSAPAIEAPAYYSPGKGLVMNTPGAAIRL